MKISGHRTREIFDRYDITSDRDLVDAAEKTLRYVEERRNESPVVVPIRAAGGEHGQSRRRRTMTPSPNGCKSAKKQEPPTGIEPVTY